MAVTGHSGKTRSVRKAPPAVPTKAKKSAPVAAAKIEPAQRNAKANIESGQWQEMVATAAYFRAEARGFRGGSPEQDWLEAESELKEKLRDHSDLPAGTTAKPRGKPAKRSSQGTR
jgi:hypothetical protein